ncbi:hypothetical protein [Thermus antranikianii]
MRRYLLHVFGFSLLGIALAQSVPVPLSGPQALPMEGGAGLTLFAIQGEVGNNALTLSDLINALALVQDPHPTDLLLLAGRVPQGQAATTQAFTGFTVAEVILPFGHDPVTGAAGFVFGASYGLVTIANLNIGWDLVALAQQGSKPGDVLRFSDTFGNAALFDRLALKAALPLLDGLLELGAEGALLIGRFAVATHFDPNSQLSYSEQGYNGQVGLSFQRAQEGRGFELGIGLRTRLPTFGISVSLRGLGSIAFSRSSVTRLEATAQNDTAYDLIQKLRNSATTSDGGSFSLPLPRELEVAGFYPILQEGFEEPVFLTLRSLVSFGGPLAQGLRLAVGASYRVLPNLPLRAEVALGGPAGLGLGIGGRIESPGGGLEFLFNQKGGFFFGSKGAEFLLRGGLTF